MPSLTRKFVQALAIGSVLIAVEAGSQPQAQAFTANTVNPIYLTNFTESQGSLTGVNAELPASFGYFFDTSLPTTNVNGLGLPILLDWADLTDAQEVDVVLWSYVGGFVDASDFNELARITFNAADADTYVQKNGFYWLPTPNVIQLGKTDTDPLSGYVVSAVTNFGPNGFRTLEGGTGTFANTFTYDGNGFNVATSDLYSEMDVPLDFVSVPPEANDPLSFYGYFNGNVSYGVPGPLPLIGAGVAFGWSRRLRRRISSSH